MFFHKKSFRLLAATLSVILAKSLIFGDSAFSLQDNDLSFLAPTSRLSPFIKVVKGFSAEIEFPMAYKGFDQSGYDLRKADFTGIIENNGIVNRILIPVPFDQFDPVEVDGIKIWEAYTRGEISKDAYPRVKDLIEDMEKVIEEKESFIIHEILQNSYDSIRDRVEEMDDPSLFIGKITVEVFHDGDDVLIRVMDNGKPVELGKAGIPNGRKRDDEIHFGGARAGVGSVKTYLSDLGGAITWYPLVDGTVTEIKAPRAKMSSRFRIEDDEFIEIARDDDLKGMARSFINLVGRMYLRIYGNPSAEKTETIITVGGNSFVRPGEKATKDEQLRNLRESFSPETVNLLKKSRIRSITHGNGPQVGIVLERLEEEIGKYFSQMTDDEVDENLVKHNVVGITQREIGDLIKQVLIERGIEEDQIEVIITHVLVDPDSPEYLKRTKPIGKVPTSGGERKKVGSPLPVEIVEIKEIAEALKAGKYVISVGGGGIPVDMNVYRERHELKVLAAVIDKDYATALLSKDLKNYGIYIDELIISTGEPYIYENYGKANERALHLLTPDEIDSLLEDDIDGKNFPDGKVRPKLRAARFAVSNSVSRVRITSPENVRDIRKGTIVIPDDITKPASKIVIEELSKKEADDIRGKIFTHIDGIGITSTIKSLHDKGVLKLLYDRESVTMADIIRETGNGNRGYLHVAMYLLQLAGWVDRRGPPGSDDMVFSLTENGKIAYEILTTPEGKILPVYGQSIEFFQIAAKLDKLLYTAPRGPLDKELGLFKNLVYKSKRNWGIPREKDKKRENVRRQIINYLDGVITGPIMVALKWDGVFDYFNDNGNKIDINRLDTRNGEWLGAMFTLLSEKGYTSGDDGMVSLTNKGHFAASRAWSYGVTVSYIPILAEVDELLFGSNPTNWKKTDGDTGMETHVNRSMNALASGASHRTYFKTIDENIIRLFNLPIDDQPKYVIDIGSGDGTLLEHIYKLVMEQTERGRLIKERPDDERYKLLMVGVDLNSAARLETRKRLERANIPHVVLEGDVNDPDDLAERLKTDLAIDIEKGIFVRSFLDHNRTYIKPKKIDDGRKSASRAAFSYEGRAIPNDELEQNLVEHLGKWAKYVGRYGLLLMELHTINPDLAAQNIGVSPALAYYATHGYSDQYIVEYAEFIKAAKEAGLAQYARYEGLYPPNGKLAEPAVSINLFVSNVRASQLYSEDIKDTISDIPKDEKRKIVFLYGKNWINDYERQSNDAQGDFINRILLQARKYFEENGIIFVDKDDAELSSLVEKYRRENENVKIVVMAGENTVTSREFTKFKNDENLLMVGINYNELISAERKGKDTVNIPILVMLNQAIKLLIFKQHDSLSSILDMKKNGGIWIFTPRAVPINYEELRDVVNTQIFA